MSVNEEITPTISPSTTARLVFTASHRRALARISKPRIVLVVARPSRREIISGRSATGSELPSSRTRPQSESRNVRPTSSRLVVPNSRTAVLLHSRTTPWSSCKINPILVVSRKSTASRSVLRFHSGKSALPDWRVFVNERISVDPTHATASVERTCAEVLPLQKDPCDALCAPNGVR